MASRCSSASRRRRTSRPADCRPRRAPPAARVELARRRSARCRLPGARTEMPALIELQGLRAWYGPIHAVHHVDLDVRQGEIVALLGANGAGKSTTLKSLAGLHVSRVGTIAFEGKDVSRLPAEKLVRRGISLAPEGRRIFAKLSVAENLALGAAARGRRARRQVDDDRDRFLDLFPILKERLHQPGGALSGGEQQQLAIARALMS